jgi:hypothetical protein
LQHRSELNLDSFGSAIRYVMVSCTKGAGAIQMIWRSGSFWARNCSSIFAAGVAGVLGLFLLAGCATQIRELTTDSSPEAKRAVVRERAEARWQAIGKGDFAAAYGYMSPASRQVVSAATFDERMRNAQLSQGVIEAVVCQGETCRVDVKMTYERKSVKGGITTPAQETWIIANGQAWYVWPL